MYHRVTELDSDPWGLCVSPAHFAEHLEVLRQRALPLRLTRLADDLRQGRVSRGAVAITFDDGYGDNLAHAFPLLRRANLPATLFVTTGILTDRREFWWDELEQILLGSNRLPPSLRLTVGGNAHEWELGSEGDCRAEEMLRHRRWRTWEPAPTLRHRAYVAQWETLFELPAKEKRRALDELCAQAEITPGQRSTHRTVSAAEIADLAQHKLVEIGAHSVTHTALSRLSAAGQRREIQGSKKHLEDILGCRVTSFSYPHGNYDENTLSIVRQAGFTCACTTAHATARPGADPFRLPRIQVLDWDGDEFARQLEACQATPHPAGT
jgi:peptidoglycan/xylan/chitin deacetylase (PgdA/CDA1 family)